MIVSVVAGAVAADVLQGLRVQGVHDGEGDVQRQILLGKVALHCRYDVAVRRATCESPCTVTPMRGRASRGPSVRTMSSDVGVHQKCFRRIADRGPSRLRVDHDVERHLSVGPDVDVRRGSCPLRVSITGTWLLRTTLSIKPAPPRGISTSTSPRAAISRLVRDLARTRHKLDCLGRQPGIDQPGLERRRRLAFESAAEEEPRSSAALPDFRQIPPASAVSIGARFVDDADDAEAALEPGGPAPRWRWSSRVPRHRPGPAAQPARVSPPPCLRCGPGEPQPIDQGSALVPLASARAYMRVRWPRKIAVSDFASASAIAQQSGVLGSPSCAHSKSARRFAPSELVPERSPTNLTLRSSRCSIANAVRASRRKFLTPISRIRCCGLKNDRMGTTPGEHAEEVGRFCARRRRSLRTAALRFR